LNQFTFSSSLDSNSYHSSFFELNSLKFLFDFSLILNDFSFSFFLPFLCHVIPILFFSSTIRFWITPAGFFFLPRHNFDQKEGDF